MRSLLLLLLVLAVPSTALSQEFRGQGTGGNTLGWPPPPCLFDSTQATPYGDSRLCSDNAHLWEGIVTADRGVVSGTAHVDFHEMGLVTLGTEFSMTGESTAQDLVISGPDTGGATLNVSLHFEYGFQSHVDPGGWGGASASGRVDALFQGPSSYLTYLDQDFTANGLRRAVANGYVLPNTPLLFRIRAMGAARAFGPADNGIPNASGTTTLHFPVGEPVFDVPAGYDVNCPTLNIVHNFWMGFDLCAAPPIEYGAAKVNSQGCTPTISSAGVASASGSAPFLVQASNVINNKFGLLFYGFAPANLPFQGGRRLVALPLHRTPGQMSGGNAGPDDCSGAYGFDMNARIRSGIDPLLVPGARVYCQFWSRDAQSPSGTGITSGLFFQICP